MDKKHVLLFRLHINIYEDVRRALIIKGFIKEDLKKPICENHPGRNFSRCAMCGVTYLCSIRVRFNFITFNF